MRRIIHPLRHVIIVQFLTPLPKKYSAPMSNLLACILKQLLLGFLIGSISFILFQLYYRQNIASSYRTNTFSTMSSNSTVNTNLLLVGIMTAQRFLDTRALAIWQTWARQVPGQVLFFVAQGTVLSERIRLSNIPIVMLRGVDDSYPPQKKSFAMLRWMFDNRLSEFHWFMRADDDLYVRTGQLKHFLLSQDSGKPHFMGQAGLGNTLEYGQLSLGVDDNYCMGGPGVLLSRETLRQLGPHLENCLANLLTSHEDVELGRCVRRHVGIACTWNYEMQTLFHNNASASLLFKPNLNSSDSSTTTTAVLHLLRRLITLHPVKQPEVIRRIHRYAECLQLAEKRQHRMDLVGMVEELEMRKKWQQLRDENGSNRENRDAIDGARFSGLKSLNSDEINSNLTTANSVIGTWDFISTDAKLIFCAHRTNCPRHTLEANWRRSLSGVITELFDRFNLDAHRYGRTLHFQNLQYGYVRVRPRYGVDMVLDMALWYRRFRSPHRSTLAVRRHVYVQRLFGPLVARVLAPPADSVINIVVALKGRADTFNRFAKNLLELSRDGMLKLVLVLYSSSPAEDASIAATISELGEKRFSIQVIQMPFNRVFNRGEALSAGAASLSSDALLFFVDVDVLINAEAIDRIRLNTICGRQVYFPIVFSEFSPQTWKVPASKQRHFGVAQSVNHFNYGQRRGYFRHFGYGIVSIFRADFDAIGQFNTSIRGWGLEDVDLFERVIKSRRLKPFRVPDPDEFENSVINTQRLVAGLIHVFHSIDCSGLGQNTTQRIACEGTRAQSLASVDFLVEQFGHNL